MDEPAIRARSAQDSLAYADSRPGMEGKVRAQIPPDALVYIESMAKNGWLEVEYDHWIPQAVVKAFGRDEAFEVWRSFIPSHIDTPLLSTMFGAAVRMFGANPGTLAWLVPKGFPNVYRNFATPRQLHKGEHSAAFVLEDIHPEVCAVPEYLLSFHASFQGLVDVMARGRPATLQADFDAAQRRATYEITW